MIDDNRFNRFLLFLLIWGLMYVGFRYLINDVIQDWFL
jgi:hypothetical protein